MRTTIALFSLVILWGWSGAAESIFPKGWTETAVLIQHPAGGGSGFFLQHSNKIFLVTAKHVIFDRTKFPSLVLVATNATCTTWSERTNISSHFTIDLAGSFTARETRGHPSRDVAVSYVGISETNGIRQSDFTKQAGLTRPAIQLVIANDHTTLFKDVLVGSDIYTFGYPSSIGLQGAPQVDQARPLVRRGIVADKDPGRRTLVLDSPAFKGNSGGPVLERGVTEFTGTNVQWHFKVIGVVVEFIPFEERWANNQFGYWNTTISNSGYSIAEPMDSVFEVVW